MAQPNIALAFGLVIAAGACTVLGALLVFFSNLANPKWLSGSLGASAGVMIYVSFVEILSTKAVSGFVDAGYEDAVARRYACFSFFAGLMVTWLLGKAVALLPAAVGACRKRRNVKTAANLPTTTTTPSAGSLAGAAADATIEIPDVQSGADRITPAAAAAASSKGAGSTPAATPAAAAAEDCRCANNSSDVESCQASDAGGSSSRSGDCRCCGCTGRLCDKTSSAETQRDLMALLAADNHGQDLARMGVLTGLAVGLHNVPEGVATFAATLASPATGVVIAIAIALHNIPEGVAVALPLYYATGSKWKGLMWAAVSAAAEPLGGLIAYAVLGSMGMSHLAFGIMFSFVAGMMVYISIRELLPTALRYDPKDSCVTACAFWGMAVMAASLLMFELA